MVTNPTGANDAEVVETGEKHDVLGRRRTPPERRAELLAAYRSSGLTQAAFAQREGLTYSTFCTWAQAEREAGRLPRAQAGRRGRRPVPATSALVRFAEVKVGLPVTPPGGLEVRLSDGTVLRGSNAAELAALVRALRK
jgi:transposase-like protein